MRPTPLLLGRDFSRRVEPFLHPTTLHPKTTEAALHGVLCLQLHSGRVSAFQAWPRPNSPLGKCSLQCSRSRATRALCSCSWCESVGGHECRCELVGADWHGYETVGTDGYRCQWVFMCADVSWWIHRLQICGSMGTYVIL